MRVRSVGGKKESDTPSGLPALWICVKNSPKASQDLTKLDEQPWKYEQCFDQLIQANFNLNCRDNKGELLAIFALNNNYLKAF